MTPLPDYIEVEIGSYCNRRCAWCPNAYSDRGKNKERIADSVWQALLADLGAYHYRGWFAFHNYNEPLADPTLFDRIAGVRQQVPRARPVVYTNGRLLSRAMLGRLDAAGIREVRVTLYPPKRRMRAEPDPEALLGFVRGLGAEGPLEIRDRERRLVCITRIGAVRLLVGAPRIAHYTTRGGAVELADLVTPGERDWPCRYPIASAAIDYHGNLKLCCHIYDSTAPDNDPYIIGNVGETPFSELWSSARMEDLRARLEAADFSELPICATCSHRMTDRFEHKIANRRARTGE